LDWRLAKGFEAARARVTGFWGSRGFVDTFGVEHLAAELFGLELGCSKVVQSQQHCGE
jgi:hypothetical protein